MDRCFLLLPASVAELASRDARPFRQIVDNSAAVTPGAKMPAHGEYDNPALDGLTAYFKTFKTAEGNR